MTRVSNHLIHKSPADRLATLKDKTMIGTIDSASDARTVNNTMRHQYRVLSDEEKKQMYDIKDIGESLCSYIERLGSKREYSIAKTKIEEAVMWAVKGLTG